MGDPAGIGPEIVVKALARLRGTESFTPLVIGDLKMLRRVAASVGAELELTDRQTPRPRAVCVLETGELPDDLEIGRDAAVTGRASAKYIETAVELWRSGEIDGLATAPISKAAIAMAGFDFPGHTEFLASLTGTPRVAMSFFGGDLRVVLLSTHVSLRDAIALVTRDNLVDLIRFAAVELCGLLGRQPRIAVAGLNPHASEGGLFGVEEEREIIPAVEACRSVHGLDVSGPYSPDTIFLRGHRGEFDAVIACYHDQATIAVKSLAFGSAVNVTLGLPLVRTSVDHGTAFDIAGKGVADESSMVAAIELAARLVRM